MLINRKIVIIFGLLLTIYLDAVSLKSVYDSALPQNGFDKWIELETGVTYTGGLLIGKISAPYNSKIYGKNGKNVKIKGNGAILDLQGSEISISFCKNRLDIENCIIINGGVRYRGDVLVNANNNFIDLKPIGHIQYVTFYNAHDYGIRVTGSGSGITVNHNLFVNSVDTGEDYAIYNGTPNINLPTGISCAASVNAGQFGYPEVYENWSYHSRYSYNDNPLYHYALL